MSKKLFNRKKGIQKELIDKKTFPKTYGLLKELKELLSDKEVYKW